MMAGVSGTATIYVERVMQTDQNGIPRRNRIDLLTPVEDELRKALLAVESAGAHPLLTEASVLIQEARDKVADFIELPKVG